MFNKERRHHVTWAHLKNAPGQGLEEQWLLRWQGRPVCSLRQSKDGEPHWSAALLESSGISSRTIVITDRNLDQAKIMAEQALLEMGWGREEGAA